MDNLVELDTLLVHSGIKGQKWGVRRFQNEDGSLTPEGRKRYGLKSDYSGLTDQQLRDAINKKRTQNQYVDLMTKDITKKQKDMSAFIKSASDVAGKSVALADKTILESEKGFANDKINELKNHNKALADQKRDVLKENSKADVSLIDKQIKDNNAEIDKYKETKDYIKLTKELSEKAAKEPGERSDFISKKVTSGELQEKTAEAYRNINEMEPDQLKKTVDRMLLERQYDELVNPPKPSFWEKGREVFQTIGVALGLLVAATTIYRNVKGIKKDSDLDDGSIFLSHYGVKGMRKGERRYQNPDGTLTPEGYRHYGIDPNGRRMTEAQAIIEKQRAQQQAQKMALRAQTKQNAYTQKTQARAAIRDARTQAQMQRIYAKEQLRAQQAQNKEDLRAKAESRENLRKNIIKGVAATAAIVGAVMIGRHILKERALNTAHMRDMEKTTLLGKQKMDELMATNKLNISSDATKNAPKVNIPQTDKTFSEPNRRTPEGRAQLKVNRERVNSNASKIVERRHIERQKQIQRDLKRTRLAEVRKNRALENAAKHRLKEIEKAQKAITIPNPVDLSKRKKLSVADQKKLITGGHMTVYQGVNRFLKHDDSSKTFDELWKFGLELVYGNFEIKS